MHLCTGISLSCWILVCRYRCMPVCAYLCAVVCVCVCVLEVMRKRPGAICSRMALHPHSPRLARGATSSDPAENPGMGRPTTLDPTLAKHAMHPIADHSTYTLRASARARSSIGLDRAEDNNAAGALAPWLRGACWARHWLGKRRCAALRDRHPSSGAGGVGIMSTPRFGGVDVVGPVGSSVTESWRWLRR